MAMSFQSCQFAVMGAGPYGLAVAAHLRGAGMDVRVFGKPMDFWSNHMPKGMLLRSPRHGSDIADPHAALTMDRYEATLGSHLPKRVPLEEFVRYGQWFQRQALPDLDDRLVTSVTRDGDEFRLVLDDGESLAARQVVIATGIGSFANYPQVFGSLPEELVSHTSEHRNRDLGRFAGRRVIVVGAGQSATESAALLHEGGAEVEMLVREPQMRWLKNGSMLEWLNNTFSPLRAPGKIGPIVLDWLIEHPRLFTMLPRGVQERWAYRAIRPAASGWLRPRAEPVTITTGRHVVAASAGGDQVHLQLSDGSSRSADHVLLGTGYKISIERYGFLSSDLMPAIRTVNGYPVLNAGFESSLPGMYFAGAAAAYSFGPLCRFVVGSRFTARTLTRLARKKPARRAQVAVGS